MFALKFTSVIGKPTHILDNSKPRKVMTFVYQELAKMYVERYIDNMNGDLADYGIEIVPYDK